MSDSGPKVICPEGGKVPCLILTRSLQDRPIHIYQRDIDIFYHLTLEQAEVIAYELLGAVRRVKLVRSGKDFQIASMLTANQKGGGN